MPEKQDGNANQHAVVSQRYLHYKHTTPSQSFLARISFVTPCKQSPRYVSKSNHVFRNNSERRESPEKYGGAHRTGGLQNRLW